MALVSKYVNSPPLCLGFPSPLNVRHLGYKCQCFARFFKQTHWLKFILCPVHYFTIFTAIQTLQIRNLKKPGRIMSAILMIESIQFGSDKMTSTRTTGHVGGQVVFSMSLIRRTSGNFGLFRPLGFVRLSNLCERLPSRSASLSLGFVHGHATKLGKLRD